MVDVFSPNHVELGACFGYSFVEGVIDLKLVKTLATTMLESGFKDRREGAIVVRAAEHGSLVVVAHPSALTWCPAFYQSTKHNSGATVAHPKIIDPTGAGNAFLGGYAIGLQETSDFVRAAWYGSVAASFALEQVGLPVLGKYPASGEEVWNGCGTFQRLEDYESRLEKNI